MARQIVFKFPLTHGLHARPASLIQRTAQKFNASISWENDRSKSCSDSKSILSLIAAETWKDDPCRIVIDGDDELEAEKALITLLENELPKCEEELPEIVPASNSEIKIPRFIRNENPLYFSGTGINGGISRAAVFVFDSLDLFHLELPIDTSGSRIVEKEIHTVQDALNRLRLELTESIGRSQNSIEKDLLNAHLDIVQDQNYLGTITNYISNQNYSAAKSVFETARYFTGILQNSKSYYIHQRLSDIKDISARVIVSLTGGHESSPTGVFVREIRLTEPAILLAENILPSQFISLDKKLLKGLVLSEAGTNSHTVILARAFNIPTITGIEGIQKKLNPGEPVIIDAGRGLIIPSPNSTISRFYDLEMEKQRQIEEKTALFIPGPGSTADGKKIEVAVNIGSVEEVESAFLNGAEGVGLFRTEWLFMDRSNAPTEEEQFNVYSRAATIAGKRPVIIRTLDIGGDKPIPYLNLPKEANPFLGYRAIRIYNDFNNLINTQLRAVLRASFFGNLKIMFPMVCCLEEILSLKKRLKSIMLELERERVPFDAKIAVGIMVEIPAVAFALAEISTEVDFFSIGSNDLVQYFLASDRGNPKLNYLYNTFYPSFLRLLKKIIADAHAQGKWVGFCGELAGNIDFLPIWIGLGFDEISLSSASIRHVKFSLKKLKSGECETLAAHLLETTTAQQFKERLNDFYRAPTDIELITEELIRLDSKSLSKEEAIRELANLLEVSGRIDNSDEVEELIWEREESYSTGLGFGVAIPHCNAPQIKNNSIVFIKLKNPIDWQSLDNQPVDMIFLLAIRISEQQKEHLRVLARLSRKLMDEEFVAKLRKVEKPADIISLIKNLS